MKLSVSALRKIIKEEVSNAQRSNPVDYFRTALSANNFYLYSDDDLLDVEEGTRTVTSILEQLLEAHPNPDLATAIENFKMFVSAYATAAREVGDEG